MKTSIKKLLSTLQFNVMTLLLVTGFFGLILFSSMATHERAQNVATQETLVKRALMLERKDLKLSQIESDGIVKRLPILIDQLDDVAFYEVVNELMIKEHEQRAARIQALESAYKKFAKAAQGYFYADGDLGAKRAALRSAADDYILALHPIATLQSEALYQYFLVIAVGFALIFAGTFVVMLITRSTSGTIMQDIHALLNLDTGVRTAVKFNTTEFNSLALKMRNEGQETIAPSRQDPITQLPNYESVKSAFEQRPVKSKNLQITVCIFQIDNYPKLVNHYPQSVIDPVMIKIASIMKLHKMQNDHVGRIDNDHFIVVMVRSDKKKAFEDCDHIRLMIEDNRFKLPHNSVPITVSGGFTVKTPSQTLDDAVKNAKEYLKVAEDQGGNVIAELKNTPKIL